MSGLSAKNWIWVLKENDFAALLGNYGWGPPQKVIFLTHDSLLIFIERYDMKVA